MQCRIRYYEASSKRKTVLNSLEHEMELLYRCINRPCIKGEKMYVEMMEFALDKMTYEEFVGRLGGVQRH